MMEWSPAKQEVFRFESDIVVSAGAGSGKTAALVELYLRLLAGETSFPHPLSVEEIVAITFTDKAAVEMRERVRKALAQRQAIGDSAAPWGKLLRALSGAPIATFHSFCARLLRENPAEAGVDPAFALLDQPAAEAELQAALDEVIESELKERSPEIRLLLEQYPLSGVRRGRGLREHLLELRRKRATDAMEGEDLRRRGAEWDALARQTFTLLPERLAAVAESLRAAIRGRELKGGKEPAFLGKMRDLLDLCASAPPSAESDGTPGLLDAMQECVKGTWGKEDAGLRGEVKDLLDAVRLAYWQLKSAPHVAALLLLAGKVDEAYRLRKARRGGLDFDDLQVKARDLLRGDLQLREECRRRFPVVMVDEFQDTNPLQKELVRLLCGEGQRLFIVGDPKQSIYLFRGADVSVFGQTRDETVAGGGRVLYFRESFRSREGIITFVNRFFSRVMAAGEAGFEVTYGAEDHLEPKRQGWDGAPCVELLTLEGDGTSEEKRSAEARAIARKILRLVSWEEGVSVYDRKTVNSERGTMNGDENLGPHNLEPAFVPRTPTYGDIAILLRRFTHLKLFERELRRHGVPYYVVKGKGFYRCQEVLDLLNFLKYLEFGSDLASLAGLLRSPLCGVSDETLYLLSRLDGGIGRWESCYCDSPPAVHRSPVLDRIEPCDRERLASLARLMARLRPLRDRLTLAELMEEILTGTDFASTLLTTFQGGQKVANLRKLIELSRSFSGATEGGVRSFVNYLDKLVKTEPTEAEAAVSAEGEDVVRLMTVHQSKGLEFPVVFLPELGAGQQLDHAPVQYDDASGIGVKLALPGGAWEQTLASRAVTELRSRKEGAELKRLLYVATTRARDYLVLSGEKGKGRSAPWREWLDDFLAGEGRELVKVSPVAAGRDRDPEEVAPAAEAAVPPGEGAYEPAAVAEGVRRAIGFVPPLPSTMVFSPTTLEDYAKCPRKYFYKGIMGLDEGLFSELLGRGPGRAKGGGGGMTPLEKGDLAHLLLERLDFSAPSALQRAACLRVAGAHAPDPSDTGVAEVIDRVIAFATSPFGRELAGERTMRECRFTLRLTGEAVYYVKGAMDLVAVGDANVTVCDYKYLRREDAELEGYRFQLRTYMLALAKRWPGKRIGGKLLFLKGGGEEAVECDVPAFERELVRIMDAIRRRSAEEEFGLMEGCNGSDCPFRQRCLKGGSTFEARRSTL